MHLYLEKTIWPEHWMGGGSRGGDNVPLAATGKNNLSEIKGRKI